MEKLKCNSCGLIFGQDHSLYQWKPFLMYDDNVCGEARWLGPACYGILKPSPPTPEEEDQKRREEYADKYL